MYLLHHFLSRMLLEAQKMLSKKVYYVQVSPVCGLAGQRLAHFLTITREVKMWF